MEADKEDWAARLRRTALLEKALHATRAEVQVPPIHADRSVCRPLTHVDERTREDADA